MNTVLTKIKQDYVVDVATSQLESEAIRGMMRALDPYSMYLNPAHYQALTGMTKGKLVGVGLELLEKKGAMVVLGTVLGSPAAKAGIQSGDQLIKIDDSSVTPDTPKEIVMQKLRGKAGTFVALSFLRQAPCTKEVVVTLKREVLQMEPIQYGFYQGILYIKIHYFHENTASLLKTILNKEKHEHGIVLDLRNNPGGRFDQAIPVAGLFLPHNALVVNVKGRVMNQTYHASCEDGVKVPLVVLINDWTASSAEIVAGALKDHKRAVLVGTRSFGKGSMQKIYAIPGYGGMKMTIARFYTPHGFVIQDHGIVPDIEVPSTHTVQPSYTMDLKKLYRIDAQFRKSIAHIQQR